MSALGRKRTFKLSTASADPSANFTARLIELPELVCDDRTLDAPATVRRRPLNHAGNHDLADIDTVTPQSRSEQADELVFCRVGECDAHGFQVDGKLVHHGRCLAECAVRDENRSIFRAFQIGKSLL